MPWAQLTYERLALVYRDLLDNCSRDQKEEILIKAVIICTEYLKRDFTKRQMSIIGFIYTFSYAYHKDTAFIPQLNFFEVAGISKTKIREELRKLVSMNVIHWDQEGKLFKILDPRKWEAPYNSGYNDQRLRELFLLNLEHTGVDVTEVVKKLRQQE